ncbi:MAG: class I SAM-dependent methyltransferase [Anaerolineales bacterium]|nr:MAG: class I SAM-dependent methyltransferase [Anaerolineales bacterium]
MSTEEHPWEQIYKKNGRVFPEPFPRFHEVVNLFIEHGCSEILDLGCGSGRHIVHLAKENFNTFGLDISPAGLCLTQEWLHEQGLESRIVLSDFRHPLPFREGSFSGVFSTQVIHHARIAAVRLAIREIWRVLSSGGVAFISVAARKDDEEFVEVEPGTIVPLTGSEAGLPHHIFSEEELRMEFRAFKVMDVSLRADGKVLVIVARKP